MSDEVLIIQEVATEVVEVVTETPEVIEVSTGLQGPQGVQGEGVPPGGSTGEILAKASPSDFDTEWTFFSGGGGGSGYVPQDPHVSSQLVAANLPVGVSQFLDADEITTGKTGRIMAVDAGPLRRAGLISNSWTERGSRLPRSTSKPARARAGRSTQRSGSCSGTGLPSSA